MRSSPTRGIRLRRDACSGATREADGSRNAADAITKFAAE